ncbi:MAG: nitroreductase family protein [Elusimicrobiota bacterium]
MSALEAIRRRITAEKFDSSRTLSEQDILELIEYATHAPSSFNQQHWRFVAAVRPEDKARLTRIAYNQTKVSDASVTFIVLGDLRAHERLGEVLSRSVAAGVLDQSTADVWVAMAGRMYADPQDARDEAVRSASLAAMTLMLAAESKGLVSGPLTSFDPDLLIKEFDIPERYVPVMLLPVGYPDFGNGPKKARLKAFEVLRFGSGRGL